MAIPDGTFTLAAAKEHLRVTWNDEDATITRMLDAAVDRCEQFCNKAFSERTLSMVFSENDLCPNAFRLPVSGYATTEEFKYTTAGGTADMPAGTYRVVSKEGEQFLEVDAWPDDAVLKGDFATFKYKTAATGVPASIVQAAHLYLGDMFENREAQQVGTIIAKNPAAEALLVPYRIGWGM